ncbi:MAG: c-type cytochrome [Sulfurimonas sp.]|uniref:c-type cytochrome n=1 Tax=Sulfurimonas sp. TaxID=2022749 RepID=UPI003D1027D5
MKIFISVVLIMFLAGCSSENKQNNEEAATEKKSIVQDVKNKALETTQEVKEEVSEKAQEVKEEVSEKAQEVKEEVSEKAQEVKEVISEKVQEVKAAVSTPEIDTAKIYSACAGCHGADGSKAALGKSQIIKGWDAKKTADALNGYKTGTYGGAMKGLMRGQVSKLNEAEIQALAEYISKL